MMKTIIAIALGLTIMFGGIKLIDMTAEKYMEIEAEVDSVRYDYGRQIVGYFYYVDGVKIQGSKTYQEDEYIFGYSVGDTIKITVNKETMLQDNVTTFKETPLRIAAYGFGGILILAGISNIFVRRKD